MENEEIVVTLYNAVLLRNPGADELAYWRNQLDLGLVTPSGMALQGALSPEFAGISHVLASMHQAAFGRYASTGELMIWRAVHDAGASLAELGEAFILSDAFRQANPGLVGTADYLQAMAQSGLGRAAEQAELDLLVPLLEGGALHYGDILLAITQLNGRGEKVGLAMLSAGVNGAAPEAAVIEALGTDVLAAISTIIAESPLVADPEPEPEPTSPFAEIDGTLFLSGEIVGPLHIDLSTLEFTIDGVAQSLASGSFASVVTVDARHLAGFGASLCGSEAAETFYASDQGDTLRGGGGNDLLWGGDGADRFLFEASAASNGLDELRGFLAGGDDVLDFSAFLNQTSAVNIATRDADSANEVVWQNGQVLVVEGYGIDDAEAVAALFGAGAPFAAPAARSKAVLISADIIGNASVWYLVNQTEVTAISAEEVSLAAVLVGVNNLGLVGFAANDFA